MDSEHAYVDTSQESLPVERSRRQRLLPFLSILVLGLVILGLFFALDEFPLPESTLHLASALASKPEIAKTISSPPAEPTLTPSTTDLPLLQSLQERQALLGAREQQLADKEKELRQLQQLLEEKLTTLSVLRKEIGALLEQKENFEEQRFEHLVKVYEGMKPAEAASLIERLQEDTAVKLFYRMKEKKVSQILEFVKPEVAAQLSERLAIQQQQTGQSSADKERR
jgi:flagellar motility protein MotE (MotC chaperone)